MTGQGRAWALVVQTLAVGLLLGASVLAPLQAQGPDGLEPGWTEPVSLSQNFPQSYLPDITADQAGNLYVVWDTQFTDRSEGWGDGVGFAMWDGAAWSTAVDIFGLALNHLPAIAADSRGRLHLIGVGSAGLGYSRAWAQHRPTDARLWSAPVDISNAYPRVYWNDMVIDSRDRIHVVFSDQAPDASRVIADGQCVGEDCSWVFYTRSTDGGDSWSTPVKISPPMASGGRVMIAVDGDDGLYVVWSTEWVVQHDAFASSANGFTYSLDAGADWSEPEVQIFETGGELLSLNDPARDYWLSVAVDSSQTVHIVTVGSGFHHLYRTAVGTPWIDGALPPPAFGDAAPGYGFRGIAIDGDDNLHFILPAYQLPGDQTEPGLFHNVWSKGGGWSHWARATRNTRGQGTGLGSVVVSGGNRLHVAWFEHLEGSAGRLFAVPRGRIEIYYASLHTGACAVPLSPLPPGPGLSPALPDPAVEVEPDLAVTETQSLAAEPGPDSEQRAVRLAPLPGGGLAVGVGATMLVLALAAGVVVLGKRR